MSEIMQALYAGDRERAEALAAGRQLDVFEASALDETRQLQRLLASEPELATARTDDDFTPLHYAAFFGGVDGARLLVARGADVDAYADNEPGVHPLNSAVAAGKLEVVELLLEAGADPNAPTAQRPFAARRRHGERRRRDRRTTPCRRRRLELGRAIAAVRRRAAYAPSCQGAVAY